MASVVTGLAFKSLKFVVDLPSKYNPQFLYNASRALHISAQRNGLEEFFDVPENYTKQEVKVGRPWEKDDLRIKSNVDLHKLWYVLLKEKNMLLTMERLYQFSRNVFPSPDRIEKVQESMKNLEDVIRERNRAYHELEIGISGERPNKKVINVFGLEENVHLEEFLEPIEREEVQEERFFPRDSLVHIFRRALGEKQRKMEKFARMMDRRYCGKMIRTFPDIDLDYLQELYPHVPVKRIALKNSSRGQFDPRDATWAKPGMF